jgi:uncharacterized membrane protein YkvA (DUF1232 family)
MDSNVLKTLLLILLVVYVLSPVDALPGPVDDLLLLFAYMATGE